MTGKDARLRGALAVVALGVFGAWVASEPAAGLTLTSQVRELHALAEFIPFFQPPNPVDEHSQSAADFGPFSASVSADVTQVSVGSARSNASQDSSIEQPLPAWLDTQMTGSAHAAASNRSVPVDQLSVGDSSYELSFDVGEESNYILHAVLAVSESSMPFATGAGRARVELLRDGGDVIEQLILETIPTQGGRADALDASGTLAPGSYLLRVVAFASAQAVRDAIQPPGAQTFSSGDASYQVALQVVPEPASALLLATGLVGLCAARARARWTP